MARRPQITDTEEDLLAFQESFLSSGQKASVSIKVLAREKRKVEGSLPGRTRDEGRRGRDVVTLNTEGKPQVKKSRFRERKEKLLNQGKLHEAMEVQDEDTSQVLTDVQEHRHVGPPTTMTALRTIYGFPVVKELNLVAVQTPPLSRTGVTQSKMKKKSLFAQQFADKTLDFFGIDIDPLTVVGKDSRSRKDDMGLTSHGMENNQALGMECVHDGAMKSEICMKEDDENDGCESSPSVLCDWLKSGLVLEAGSWTEGEMIKTDIHEENINLLSGLSEEDILQKQQQLEKALRPDLVSFIKSRRQQSNRIKESGKEEAPHRGNESQMETSCTILPDEAKNTGETSHLHPPEGWLHMDVVEREKLEWMVDVSRAAPTSSRLELDKIETRFSLEGLVISRSTDMPSHLGLHHHGDEPEAAGYTLAELLPLCRSTILQQRVLSLQILSRILHCARKREYEGLVVGSIMGTLVGAQLPLLLRFSLDESTKAVVKAAVQVMHTLLVVTAEEVMLDEFSLCYSGNFLPSLTPQPVPEAERKEGEVEDEERGTGVLQKDIVAGYLRMNILPRLRYILEVLLPAEPLVIHKQLLEVLTRIARHSVATATQVVDCPRLMRVVFERHLPLCWSAPDAAGGGEGTPQPQVAAVKLVKALCTAGRNLAKRLLSDYSLMSVLTCYAVLLPSELNLPLEEAYPLATVALSTWQVLLSYGLSDEVFRDVFPVFLKQMQMLTSMTNLSSVEVKRVASLLGVAESGVCVAAVTPEQLKLGSSEMLPSPAVVWGHANGMAIPLMHALAVWTKERTSEGPGMVDAMLIIGNLLHVLSTYFSKLQPKAGKEPGPLKVLEQVETLVTVLSQLLNSSLFTMALHVLRDSSEPSSNINHASLPSHFIPPAPTLGALYSSVHRKVDSPQFELLHGEDVSLRCTNLVDGFARLSLACMQLHRGVLERVAASMFTCPAYHQMLGGCLTREGTAAILLTSYIKSHLIHASVKIFIMWAEACSSSVDQELVLLMQAVSFHLLITLPAGLEAIGRDLYSSVIFHPVFYRNLEGGIKCAYLKILDPIFPIRGHSFSPVRRTTLLYCAWQVPTPADWILSPLREGIQASKRHDINKAMVKYSLSFLLLLEQQHPRVLSGLSVAARIASVMCIFLMDGALFLESPFRSLLQALLELYVREDVISRVNLTSPIPGLPSFRDLYISFLEGFTAVSYGDHLFGSFVLLPFMQRFPVSLRQMVWGDHTHILSLLSIPLDQSALDIQHFLYPSETDGGLIERYMAAIATGQVRKTVSPLPYLIAVHHIHSFTFLKVKEHSSSDVCKKLVLGMLLLKDRIVRDDLLLYSGYTPSSPAGFERSSEMKREVEHFISIAGGSLN